MPLLPIQSRVTRYLTRAGGSSRAWARVQTRLAQLEQARDEAREAHRAKSAFLAGLSHQLRTPLSTILLCSELLSDDLTQQGLTALTGDVERIQSAGKHLLGLLDAILDLTRMEAGRMLYSPEDTDLPALAGKLGASFRALALKNSNHLELRCAQGLADLHTDPGKLEQILFHLLDNALKYTRAGTVTLAIRPDRDGAGVVFTVRDTGRGMSPEQVERIRQDFQAADTHPATYGSAGLGLTLCRRLAQGLGGGLQVESVEGSGSAFTLRMPRRPPRPGFNPDV